MENISEFLESSIGLKLIKSQILEKLDQDGYVIVQKYSLNEIGKNLFNSEEELWDKYDEFLNSSQVKKVNYFNYFLIIFFSIVLILLGSLFFIVENKLKILLGSIIIMVIGMFYDFYSKTKDDFTNYDDVNSQYFMFKQFETGIVILKNGIIYQNEFFGLEKLQNFFSL